MDDYDRLVVKIFIFACEFFSNVLGRNIGSGMLVDCKAESAIEDFHILMLQERPFNIEQQDLSLGAIVERLMVTQNCCHLGTTTFDLESIVKLFKFFDATTIT